jgi:hypothetical protein
MGCLGSRYIRASRAAAVTFPPEASRCTAKETKLLSPFAESHFRFLKEETLSRSLACAALGTQLF